jgi:hypothetical protein
MGEAVFITEGCGGGKRTFMLLGRYTYFSSLALTAVGSFPTVTFVLQSL